MENLIILGTIIGYLAFLLMVQYVYVAFVFFIQGYKTKKQLHNELIPWPKQAVNVLVKYYKELP